MQLDHVEARLLDPQGTLGELLGDVPHLVGGERPRRATKDLHRRRRDRLGRRPGEAPRVIELDAGESTLLLDGLSQPGQAVQAFVGVGAEFSDGPARPGVIDAGVLDDHQRDTASGHQTIVVQERRVHHALFTRVAQEQGRHGEPVLELQPADLIGGEQMIEHAGSFRLG